MSDTYTAAIPIGVPGITDDRRGRLYSWRCGRCGKNAPHPMDTMFPRPVVKQCDYCLEENFIDPETFR